MSKYLYENVDLAVSESETEGGLRFIHIRQPAGVGGASHSISTDPAELHKLTEAIHGRKIAAIVYEDELPEFEDVTVAPATPAFAAGDAGEVEIAYGNAAKHRRAAANHVALARHIEARDAAAKERERVEEEAVRAKAEELYGIYYAASGMTAAWDLIGQGVRDGFVALARQFLADEQEATS
jgi:hypothetical protein